MQNAAEFVPSFVNESSREARLVDDAMATFHHFVTVNDTETLAQANSWLGTEEEWIENGAEWTVSDGTEEYFAPYLDFEDRLRDSLYTPPQQAKGERAGRARCRANERSWQ